MAKVGFMKLGNIGTSIVVDLLLDERADREIDVKIVGSGAKMGKDEASEVATLMDWKPDLVVVISPNAAMPGSAAAREAVGNTPCIVISDGPSKKIKDELTEGGFGYLIINGDPLIGARREFLDPAEMALFNANAVKVLSITGALRLVQEEVDRVIEEIGAGGEVTLPRIVVTAEKATERARFSNPYARAKAIAAYNMVEKTADINVQACFVIQEPERYIMMAAASHEVMSAAARLADEARELEKSTDQVSRRPHADSGNILDKTKLLEKPQ